MQHFIVMAMAPNEKPNPKQIGLLGVGAIVKVTNPLPKLGLRAVIALGRAIVAMPLSSSMNPVVYFEIPVSNMHRACVFYERVFKVSLEVREIDGNEMALFSYEEGQPGASGALARGSSYVPGKAGARVYFGVDDIVQTLQLAVAAGAEVNYPVTEVPEYGWVAEFIDVEGNCIALYSSQAPFPESGSAVR